ncbi:hypothetical protein BIW11_04151 [Tropilaelaps mercedesae]|uniref:Uncharacterized protein n=1 Tax=Tropilaelaps mercedesae TaxID=418985 RepID=A0A1V9XAN8_9ACAR|nr:hypothetical protein BIW11_04151 [Tropilaelaps mercedesae]
MPRKHVPKDSTSTETASSFGFLLTAAKPTLPSETTQSES